MVNPPGVTTIQLRKCCRVPVLGQLDQAPVIPLLQPVHVQLPVGRKCVLKSSRRSFTEPVPPHAW